MIGLSLSRCVADIARGTVAIEDVERIVSRTMARNGDDWKLVIADYRAGRWIEFPDRAEQIFHQLSEMGKIEQPRLISPIHFPQVEGNKHWVSSMDEIVWVG